EQAADQEVAAAAQQQQVAPPVVVVQRDQEQAGHGGEQRQDVEVADAEQAVELEEQRHRQDGGAGGEIEVGGGAGERQVEGDGLGGNHVGRLARRAPLR